MPRNLTTHARDVLGGGAKVTGSPPPTLAFLSSLPGLGNISPTFSSAVHKVLILFSFKNYFHP